METIRQIGKAENGGIVINGNHSTIHFYMDRFQDVGEPAPDTSGTCPYRGLEAFQTNHAPWFAGRSREISELIELICARPLTGLVAASGAGKSSMVLAGLIPTLAANRRDHWDIFSFKPGDDPVAALIDVLARRVTIPGSEASPATAIAELSDLVHARKMSIARILTWLPTPDIGVEKRQILIVVDQFEELYTQASRKDRALILENLLDVSRRDNHRVLVTMRADFLGQMMSEDPVFFGEAKAGLSFLTPMDEAGIRDAIQVPAAKVGLTIPKPLVDLLVADTRGQPGFLPYLQFALRQLWTMRDQDAQALTVDAYHAMGRMKGAIDAHARAVFAELSDAEQSSARALLPRFVGTGARGADTSLRHPLSRFEGAQVALLRKLAGPRTRLMVLSSKSDTLSEPDTYVEFSHEALVREWRDLQGWIEEKGSRHAIARKLEAEAIEWDRGGRSRDLLEIPAKRLPEAQELVKEAEPGEISKELEAYVGACGTRHKQRRVALNSVIALAFGLLTGGVWYFQNLSAHNEELLESLTVTYGVLDGQNEQLETQQVQLNVTLGELRASETRARELSAEALKNAETAEKAASEAREAEKKANAALDASIREARERLLENQRTTQMLYESIRERDGDGSLNSEIRRLLAAGDIPGAINSVLLALWPLSESEQPELARLHAFWTTAWTDSAVDAPPGALPNVFFSGESLIVGPGNEIEIDKQRVRFAGTDKDGELAVVVHGEFTASLFQAADGAPLGEVDFAPDRYVAAYDFNNSRNVAFHVVRYGTTVGATEHSLVVYDYVSQHLTQERIIWSPWGIECDEAAEAIGEYIADRAVDGHGSVEGSHSDEASEGAEKTCDPFSNTNTPTAATNSPVLQLPEDLAFPRFVDERFLWGRIGENVEREEREPPSRRSAEENQRILDFLVSGFDLSSDGVMMSTWRHDNPNGDNFTSLFYDGADIFLDGYFIHEREFPFSKAWPGGYRLGGFRLFKDRLLFRGFYGEGRYFAGYFCSVPDPERRAWCIQGMENIVFSDDGAKTIAVSDYPASWNEVPFEYYHAYLVDNETAALTPIPISKASPVDQIHISGEQIFVLLRDGNLQVFECADGCDRVEMRGSVNFRQRISRYTSSFSDSSFQCSASQITTQGRLPYCLTFTKLHVTDDGKTAVIGLRDFVFGALDLETLEFHWMHFDHEIVPRSLPSDWSESPGYRFESTEDRTLVVSKGDRHRLFDLASGIPLTGVLDTSVPLLGDGEDAQISLELDGNMYVRYRDALGAD